MGKLIFLAAIEDEFAPLKSRILASEVRHDIHYEFVALGVGVINSLITLEKHVDIIKNKHVIFLGTAGIMGNQFVPGETYQASFFRWTSIGLALQKGFLPESLYPDIEAQRFLVGPQNIPVISTPEITTDDKTASAFQRQHGPCLENLEVYGVAYWFKRHNRSLAALLSVTNQVGKESHSHYVTYRDLAWAQLAETVQRVVMEGEKKV